MPDAPRRVALLTREYPPDVYGGAGVHVEYLSRELAQLVDVTVHCFGAPNATLRRGADRDRARAVGTARRAEPVRRGAAGDLGRSRDGGCGRRRGRSSTATPGTRTSAGHLAKLVHGVPHVATVHSLEPLRPWKVEQLGGGYARVELVRADRARGSGRGDRRLGRARAATSSRCYPVVDPARVTVIGNGIDTDEYRPDRGTDVLERYGVDPDRAVRPVRRPDHAAEGRSPTCSTPRRTSTPRRSWCSAPARPTRRSSPPRSQARIEELQRARAASSGSSRCCRRPR